MTKPRKFRKKPVVIVAMQWTGENIADVDAFAPAIGQKGCGVPGVRITHSQRMDCGNPPHRIANGYPRLLVMTPEGPLWANVGDWIIRGVKGEFYPIKPDILAVTYDDEGEATE